MPLYDSLGENAIEYIINHSEAMVAFVASAKLPSLVKGIGKTKGVLKAVVYWGAAAPASIEVNMGPGQTNRRHKIWDRDSILKVLREAEGVENRTVSRNQSSKAADPRRCSVLSWR